MRPISNVMFNIPDKKIMKTGLTFILIAILTNSLAQPATNDEYVQNFYTTCKPGKFSAFQDIQVGVQLLDTKQYSRSIKRFTEALTKDKTCTDPYYMLAFCYQRTGKLNEAIAYADSSIMYNSSSPSAWIIKGTTLLMLNDTINSEICFKKAIESAPDKLDGYYGLALTYYTKKGLKESHAIITKFESLKIKPTVIRDGKKMNKLMGLLTQ
jgi:tetratricopeptide (TPR) repeat protein